MNDEFESTNLAEMETTASTYSNVIVQSGEGTPGQYFSLNTLLSGDTYQNTSDNLEDDQIKFKFNPSDYTSMGKFGSVYSKISSQIEKIKDEYPPSFYCSDAEVVAGKICLPRENIEQHQTIVDSYSATFVGHQVCYSGEYYSITEISAATDSFELTVTPIPIGATSEAYVVPTQAAVNDFKLGLSEYGKYILRSDQIGGWPRYTGTNELAIYRSGVDYASFASAELSIGSLADTVSGSNVMWSKLFPWALAEYDSSDNLLQRLIYTYGHNFDRIKEYQDALEYVHTCNHKEFEQVHQDLLPRFAKHFGWEVVNHVNAQEYGRLLNTHYPHYHSNLSGISDYNFSSEDISYESNRRFLSNLVHFYKQKGTKESIYNLMTAYSVPEELFRIDELVSIEDRFGIRTYKPTYSNVSILTGSTYHYMSAGTMIPRSEIRLRNTRSIDIGIFPIRAIEHDQWEWASTNGADITGYNGVVSAVTSFDSNTQQVWENELLQFLIPSDGSHLHTATYPNLRQIETDYLNNSVNRLTKNKLEVFLSIFEDVVPELVKKSIPAGSKLRTYGRTWENAWWRRQKHKHQQTYNNNVALCPFDEEINLDVVELDITIPIQEESTIDYVSLAVEYSKQHEADIESMDISQTLYVQYEELINVISLEPTFYKAQTCNEIDINLMRATYEIPYAATTDISYFSSGQTYTATTPTVEVITAITTNYGTTNFTAITGVEAIVTNTNSADIALSATNLSSESSKLTVNLFKRHTSEELEDIKQELYPLIWVFHETEDLGIYRVATTQSQRTELKVGDEIKLDLLSYIDIEGLTVLEQAIVLANMGVNSHVTIVEISATGQSIKTEPSFNIRSLGISNNHIIQFHRTPSYFDWNRPIQNVEYDISGGTIENEQSGFSYFTGTPTVGDSYITGVTTIGGVDVDSSGGAQSEGYGADLLVDKNEYFWATKIESTVPWYDDLDSYEIENSSLTSLTSNFIQTSLLGSDMNYIGRHFSYIKTPRSPELTEYIEWTGSSRTQAVSVSFMGVGDADRLEVQYLQHSGTPVGDDLVESGSPWSSLTGWSENSTTVGLTIVEGSITDSTTKTVRATLEPETWYWWRVKNVRTYTDMFNRSLETYTSSQPSLMRTGAGDITETIPDIQEQNSQPPNRGGGNGGVSLPD